MPIAFYPRGEDDFPFSGAAVVDHANTSGWDEHGRPAIVVAYTSTGRGECMTYSNDEGMTWQEYAGNPVIKHSGRDPKLFWHAPAKHWVMVVYSERSPLPPAAGKRHGIAIYTSADLKTWQERDWIEGFYECPDLFELPIDDDPKNTKWVLTHAAGSYVIGSFDGARFTPEGSHLPAPMGAGPNDDFPIAEASPRPIPYAAQTFSNHPAGERVQLAWARVNSAGAPFSQLMAFPTRLSLRTTVTGVRLCYEPIDAIRSLRGAVHEFPAGPLTGTPLLTDLNGDAWELEIVIRTGAVSPIMLTIAGDEYYYQPDTQMLGGPNGFMPIPLTDDRLTLRILVDRTTVEVFGDRGQAYGMFIRSRPGESAPLSLRTWPFPDGLHLEKLRIYALRSAWIT